MRRISAQQIDAQNDALIAAMDEPEVQEVLVSDVPAILGSEAFRVGAADVFHKAGIPPLPHIIRSLGALAHQMLRTGIELGSSMVLESEFNDDN